VLVAYRLQSSPTQALFIGGATRRFSSLKFAFLEDGVTSGCSLLAALISKKTT
jgi:hypothetical protein